MQVVEEEWSPSLVARLAPAKLVGVTGSLGAVRHPGINSLGITPPTPAPHVNSNIKVNIE